MSQASDTPGGPSPAPSASTAERYRQAKRGALVGVVVNTALGAAKIAMGVIGRSVAVISDGFHTLSDTLSSVVLLAGLRQAERPADARHPYGHHKAEPLAGRLMASLLVLFAVGILWHAGTHLFGGEPPAAPGALALWACVLSIVVKEGLFQYKVRVADRTFSEAVRVDAWHHRSDAFSSVAALAGVIAAKWGGGAWAVADPIAGVVIAAFIGYVGVRAFVQTTHDLMDGVPYVGVEDDLHRLAREVAGVRHTDDANVRKAGMQLFAEIHVEVDPRITVEAGHDIAGAVRDRIKRHFPQMQSVLVHIEPFEPAEHGPDADAAPPAPKP